MGVDGWFEELFHTNDARRDKFLSPVQVHGTVLVWGATDPGGCMAVQEECGFRDVLSVEAMLDDMHQWAPPHWTERVNQLRYWSNALYEALL